VFDEENSETVKTECGWVTVKARRREVDELGEQNDWTMKPDERVGNREGLRDGSYV